MNISYVVDKHFVDKQTFQFQGERVSGALTFCDISSDCCIVSEGKCLIFGIMMVNGSSLTLNKMFLIYIRKDTHLLKK